MNGLKFVVIIVLSGGLLWGQTPTLKTITLDGDPSDWVEVLANPLQTTSDADGSSMFADQCAVLSSDRDCPVGSTGRDLNAFAWTFDNANIYLYQTRYGSSSNVQDFWFYMDVGQDETMGNGDFLLRVKYQGSNRSTEIVLHKYVQDGPDPDPMVDADGYADGHDVLGSPGAVLSTVKAVYGFATGLGFEAAVPWTALGVPAGTGIFFHVGSSNGGNIPAQLNDNCGGPDGRMGTFGFYLVDIDPDRSASTPGDAVMAYAHTVTNTGTFVSNINLAVFSTRGFAVTLYSVVDDGVMATDSDGDGVFDVLDPAWDRNGDGLPDTGDLAPGEAFALEVRVTIPGGLPPGADVTTVTASVIGHTAADSVADTTYIGDIQLEADQVRTGVPGGVSRFPLTLLHYLVPDTVRLLGVSSQGWALSFYADPEGDEVPNDWMGTDADGDGDFSGPGDGINPAYDSDGDGFPDTGHLGTGVSFPFVVECAVPLGTPYGTDDDLVFHAVTSAANGAASDTALGTLEVLPRLTFTPDYTVAAGTNLFVAAGFSVLFPHAVVNSSDAPDRADLSVTADQGATARFWSDPDCNGDIADGSVIAETGLLPAFGGKECVILEVSVPNTVVKGSTVQALAQARSQADPATVVPVTDEARVSQIVPYKDALYSQQASRFAHCQTLYPRGYYFDPSFIYYLRYDDPTPNRIRDAVFVANGLGQFSDAYAFGADAAAGIWSLHADWGDELNPLDDIAVTLEPFGNVNALAPFGAVRQRHDAVDSVSVECAANNTNLGGRYADGVVRTVLVNEAETLYWDGTAFIPYSGVEWSRTLAPRSVGPQSSEAFPHTFAGVDFPAPGIWKVKGVWEASCGYRIAEAESTYLVDTTLSGFEDDTYTVPAAQFNLHDPVYLAGQYYYRSVTLVLAFYRADGTLISALPAPTDENGRIARGVDTSTWDVEGTVHAVAYPAGHTPPPVWNGADPMLLGSTDFALVRLPGLLRNDQYPTLGTAIFKQEWPADPALDPAADLVKSDFRSGDGFPPFDADDLLPGASAVIFYEMSQAGDALRLTKGSGKIIITF